MAADSTRDQANVFGMRQARLPGVREARGSLADGVARDRRGRWWKSGIDCRLTNVFGLRVFVCSAVSLSRWRHDAKAEAEVKLFGGRAADELRGPTAKGTPTSSYRRMADGDRRPLAASLCHQWLQPITRPFFGAATPAS